MRIAPERAPAAKVTGAPLSIRKRAIHFGVLVAARFSGEEKNMERREIMIMPPPIPFLRLTTTSNRYF